MASNYTGPLGGSVHGLGQGRIGNTRPGVVARATWCRMYGALLTAYTRVNTLMR